MFSSDSPASPRRVVIRMTPFAPRTPNTAVAEASFKIETEATSFGSSVAILSRGTPSIKISGDASFKVPIPRR